MSFGPDPHPTWLFALSLRRWAVDTEIDVYDGKNEYSFTKLTDPPSFDPTLCSKCRRRIVLGEDSYTQLGNTYTCVGCYGGIPSV